MKTPNRRRHGFFSPPTRRATGMERASERTSGTAARSSAGPETIQFHPLLAGQAEMVARRVAESLRRLGEESLALAHGRPHDGPTMADHLRQAGDALLAGAERADALADDLVRPGGLAGLVEDLADFGRRRPGRFVLAATAAGVVAGRAVQTGWASGQAVAAREDSRSLVDLSPEALEALVRRLWPGGSEVPPVGPRSR